MSDLDFESLLAPVSEDAPAGADLCYDPGFLALEEAARGKQEQQFGATVIAAREPDWRRMEEAALALLPRTRDLRIALHLMHAQARTQGLPGICDGIALVHGLLDRQWASVHPQLDAGDRDDPTMRLNALAPLGPAGFALADLRRAVVGPARAGLTVREIELGLGKAQPLPGESVPKADGVREALVQAQLQVPELGQRLADLQRHVRGIRAVLEARVAAGTAPDLAPLCVLTDALADAARAAAGGEAMPAATAAGAPPAASDGVAIASVGTGAISSRDDAVRALDRVCDWIARHEPTNPAPLLIRRAQRLMTKSFLDIVRDLAPDSLREIQRIAGVEAE